MPKAALRRQFQKVVPIAAAIEIERVIGAPVVRRNTMSEQARNSAITLAKEKPEMIKDEHSVDEIAIVWNKNSACRAHNCLRIFPIS